MSWQRVSLRHGGHWEQSAYVGGDSVAIHITCSEISYVDLINQIRSVLNAPEDRDYVIFYLDAQRSKVSLQNDTDLLRFIVQGKVTNHVLFLTERRQYRSKNANVGGTYSEAENVSITPPQPPSCTEPDDEEVFTSDDERAERDKELNDSLIQEFSDWLQHPKKKERIVGSRKLSSDHQPIHEEPVMEHNLLLQRKLSNWMIPMPDFDILPPPMRWVEEREPEDGELAVGSTFRKKSDLEISLGMHHLESRLEYVTDRSNKKRCAFVCKHGRKVCTFRLCASGSDDTLWMITKLNLSHTCQTILHRTSCRRIKSVVAASYFSRKLVKEGDVLKPKDMITELRERYGVEMDYSFTLRARSIAIEMAYGSYAESYHRLASYLYILREQNPGTFYEIQSTRNGGVFQHMFLALGQSISAFYSNLRPVIVVDGTHLKGKSQGILFVAMTKDGNENAFPLAIGIGPKENDESWTWFLHNLSRCFNRQDGLIVVSDQHKSIQTAVASAYPNAVHGFCIYHIKKNLVRYGGRVRAVITSASNSYRVETMHRHLADLERLSPDGAYKRMLEIGVERWSRAMCPVRRYGFMTSNIAECFNSRMVWARRLPVCSLVEAFRAVLEQWFQERSAKAASREHELTEETFNKLTCAVEHAMRMVVRDTTTPDVYKVEDGKLSFQVDLQNRTCECRRFELDEIPCSHAAAAVRQRGLHIYDFVSGYYKQHNLMETYSTPIKGLPHPAEWVVPAYITDHVIHPPVAVRQAGRPRMSRARSSVEGNAPRRRSQPQKCSKCNSTTHNARKCDQVVLPTESQTLEDDQNSQPTVEPIRQKRQKKKCSVCRSADHNIQTCPVRGD